MSAPLAWALADPTWPASANQAPEETAAGEGERARENANRAMDRYAHGEDRAFAEVYDFLAPKLHRFLLRQTRDVSAAEDLLQQTMLKLHVTRGDFLRGADVVPWAFAIARRLFIDGYRRRKREAASREAQQVETTTPAHRADDLLEAKRTAVELERELARLPDGQRVVFELMKRDGLTLREVAQILGTTTNAVKLRAHRAHAALRIAMSELGDDDDT